MLVQQELSVQTINLKLILLFIKTLFKYMTIRKKNIRRRKMKKRIKHSNHRYSFCLVGSGNTSKCNVCLRRSGRTRTSQQLHDHMK